MKWLKRNEQEYNNSYKYKNVNIFRYLKYQIVCVCVRVRACIYLFTVVNIWSGSKTLIKVVLRRALSWF